MHFKMRILTVLLFLEFTRSSANIGSSTTKLNKTTFNKKIMLYNNVTLADNRSQIFSLRSSTNSRIKPSIKWKIGRVTNRQYGIINILWQKTKLFIDQDYSNFTCKATTLEMIPNINNKPSSFKKETKKLSTIHEKLQSSTPSFIEFYYLDQSDERMKRKHPSNAKLQKLKKGNKTNVEGFNNNKSSIASLFKIHINTSRSKHPTQPSKAVHKVGQGIFYPNKRNKSRQTKSVSGTPLTTTGKAKTRSSKHPKKQRLQQTFHYSKTILANPKTKRHERKVHKGNNHSYTTELTISSTFVVKSFLVPTSISTAYDKVKFFELYDNNTPKWKKYTTNNFNNNINYNNNNKDKNSHNDEKILLHHVNENIGHHLSKNKTRFVKKHIQDLYKKEVKFQDEINISKHFHRHNLKFSLSTSKFHVPFQKNSSWSRPTVWANYPFVAVYIYEPSQVHCDAAGISPHWLLAAASCLSRHRKGFRGGGLSAFVTFCGDNWRYPKIISYVKRTLIHPMYHPRDSYRRLFNTGLIQVVNSMADTCSGWAPASLMSHQYTVDEKGSMATAVGWGLDRYDESYTAASIPNHPLMIYEGRVYSDTCPGSTEYSQANNSDEVGIRNVYCLLLPPYLAEENDTVHGALLLIGGKLLALYLKEERRPSGVQSAQYASIWRQLPWLAETAREPDDTFHFEI